MSTHNFPNFVDLEHAADLLRAAQRVMVFGTSGGGKSTLSQEIARAFDLKYFSYDRDVRWLPGWKVRDRTEQRRRVEKIIAEERWIADGTSLSTFDLRLSRADLAIWMRPSRYRALWGIAKRVTRNYGEVRSDMAEGCPEILPDYEFLHYIWNFERRHAPRVIQAIQQFRPSIPVVQISTHKQADKFVSLAKGQKAFQTRS